MRAIFASALLVVLSWSHVAAQEGCLKRIESPPTGYDHNKFGVAPTDQHRTFSAYVVSFDGSDDDNGDGTADKWRVPEWVAYEMRASESPKSSKRPRNWCYDETLDAEGLVPRDNAYRYSREFRKANTDWYVRGHLAMKYHAERVSANAAWNTHSTLNAVPQRQSYNAGSWLSLECITGAWANRYKAVWVVTGPIFHNGQPTTWIGEIDKGEKRVAVPDQLFKVVIRNDDGIKVLAFLSDNVTELDDFEPDHISSLRSVSEIEDLTNLVFTKLSTALKVKTSKRLWPVSADDFLSGCKGKRVSIR